jgi:hypothetical protein
MGLPYLPKPQQPKMAFAPNGEAVDMNALPVGKNFSPPKEAKPDYKDYPTNGGIVRVFNDGKSKVIYNAPEKPEKGPAAPAGYRWKGDGLEPIPGGPAVAKSDKALTESQAKAAVFLGQMKAASGALSGLAQGGFTGKGSQQGPLAMASAGMDAESLTGKAMGAVGNVLAGESAQKYTQAQEQWAEAFLRFKTGAASTPSEVRRNIRTFFPQPGDTAGHLAQKAEMRQNAEADIAMAAGNGADRIPAPTSMKPAAPKRKDGWGMRRLE